MPDHRAWPDIDAALAAGAVPLLPFGAHEQHGPHLPLATDTIMAAGLADRIASTATTFTPWVLPPVAYGQTTDNDGFPGTVTLSFDTVRAVATDIAASVRRHGARALIVVNGDFGNRAPLRLAATEVDLPVLIVNYPGLDAACAELCTAPAAGFGLRHADEFETSVVLALDPQAVDPGRAAACYPDYPQTFPDRQIGLHELSPSGVFGDPTAATAAKGEALLDRLTAAAVELIEAFLAELDRPQTAS